MKKGFTLLELIIAIIIIGILATLGLTQYANMVESDRLAEAKVGVGLMRQLAHEYYLKNGSLTGILNSDVGVDSNCKTTSFYRFSIGGKSATYLNLWGERCTNGGKTPDASRMYKYGLRYYPRTGQTIWYCYYSDDTDSGCFGLPTWP